MLHESTKLYRTPVLVLIVLPFIVINVLFSIAAIAYMRCAGIYHLKFL